MSQKHTALVLGCGQMGQAVAYGLDKLGFNLVLADCHYRNIKETKDLIGIDNHDSAMNEINLHWTTPDSLDMAYLNQAVEKIPFSKINIVISCLPFNLNAGYASAFARKQIPWVDLGGNPQVNKKIENFATNFKSTTFCEMGLAPGFANIYAQSIWQGGETLKIQVGGLPVRPRNRLKYNLSFSVDGLVNEYFGEDRVLVKGKETRTWCPDLREEFVFKGVKYESFATVGGLSKTLDWAKKQGIKNCAYKTIRYDGHMDYLLFLQRECCLSEAELKGVFSRACGIADNNLYKNNELVADKILMVIEQNNSIRVCQIDADRKWTAMQKGTGFPTAAAAKIILDNDLKGVLSYEDFMPYCDKLIELTETIIVGRFFKEWEQ